MVRIDFVSEYKIFNKDYVFMFVSNISSFLLSFQYISLHTITTYVHTNMS